MSRDEPSQGQPLPTLKSRPGLSIASFSISGSQQMRASCSVPSRQVCDCPLWLHRLPLRYSPCLLPLSRHFCPNMVPPLNSRIWPPVRPACVFINSAYANIRALSLPRSVFPRSCITAGLSRLPLCLSSQCYRYDAHCSPMSACVYTHGLLQ